jgi:hypothetical protein
VEPRGGAPAGWLPTALRRLERKLGADREGRTLWVWVVPAATVVITFAILAVIGVQGNVDLSLTIPMAVVLSVFLGSLSAIYLTAASADERDQDGGPDDRRGPRVPPPDPPPGGVPVTIVRVPSPSPGPVEQPTPVGTGSALPR